MNGVSSPALWGSILNKPSGLITERFLSSDQTWTLAGSLSLNHGLTGCPRHIDSYLVCQTPEGAYSIGDVVRYLGEGGAGTNRGAASVVSGTTALSIRFASSSCQIPRKDTGVQFDTTPANWKWRFDCSL